MAAIFPAVAVNVAEMAFAGTVTERAGIGSRLLLLASPTTVPPFGAALLNVTAHVVDVPALKLVGLHASEESVREAGGATKLIVADRETPFGRIAEASFEYALSAPALSTAVVT